MICLRARDNLPDLRKVPSFVLTEKEHPLIAIERTKKWMRRAHPRDVEPIDGRDGGQRPLADLLQRRPRLCKDRLR